MARRTRRPGAPGAGSAGWSFVAAIVRGVLAVIFAACGLLALFGVLLFILVLFTR